MRWFAVPGQMCDEIRSKRQDRADQEYPGKQAFVIAGPKEKHERVEPSPAPGRRPARSTRLLPYDWVRTRASGHDWPTNGTAVGASETPIARKCLMLLR